MLQGKLLNEVPLILILPKWKTHVSKHKNKTADLLTLQSTPKELHLNNRLQRQEKWEQRDAFVPKKKKKKKERGGTANAKAANGAVHDARVIRRCIMGACIFISCKRKGSDVTCCYESQ